MASLDAEVWGPHYWMFLMTAAASYPDNPNAVIKRKFYDLIQNMPVFIPNHDIADNFSRLLDRYPVTPYLDSRSSLMKWVHFIHNRVNVSLGRDEMSLSEAMERYYTQFKPRRIQFFEELKAREKIVYFFIVVAIGYALYNYRNTSGVFIFN